MHSEGEDEFAVCLDASDGAEIWRSRTDDNYQSGEGSGPRSTPAVDGDTVYVLSAKGKLYGLDAGNGEKVWGHDFVTEFESGIPGFGFSTSPIIEGDSLLIEAGGKDGKSIVAFDKGTGAILWTSHTDGAGYSSPIVIDSNGVRQAIFLTGKSLVSVSPGGRDHFTGSTSHGPPETTSTPQCQFFCPAIGFSSPPPTIRGRYSCK